MGVRHERSFLAVCLAFGTASCAGEEGAGPSPVTNVAVTPATAKIDQFDSLQFSATARDAQGTILTTYPVDWSTDAGTKASLSSNGLLVAFSPGVFTVTATVRGVTGNAAVTIVIPVTQVVLDNHIVALIPEDTFRLRVALHGPGGVPPTDTAITWSTSNANLATVSPTGLVTAKRGGVAQIRAAAGNHADSALVTIAPSVATITITPDSVRSLIDTTVLLIPTLLDVVGDTIVPRPLIWNTSNAALTTVSSSGLAHIIGPGQVTITASREGITASARIIGYLIHFRTITSGSAHVCGLGTDSLAYCWGDDHYGQSGDSVYSAINPLPVPVVGAHRFGSITGGGFHNCGMDAAGAGWCWGFNPRGQLGAPGPDIQVFPQPVSGAQAFATIVAGLSSTCAIVSTGATVCWGANDFGQLGNGTTDTAPTTTPVLVQGGHTFESVAVGGTHVCALTLTHLAYCWGDNGHGMLGTGDSISISQPIAVAGTIQFAEIGTGVFHSCGLDVNGTAYCWGNNHEHQLGTGDTVASGVPVQVIGGLSFASLAVGYYHTCGIAVGGAAYCWGRGYEFALGTGTPDAQNMPSAVVGGLVFTQLAAGEHQTCGLTAASLVYCWGSNAAGQIGDGTTSGGFVPTRVRRQG